MGEWVNAVLDYRADDATRIVGRIASYPIALTRSLDTVRRWLRTNTRGLRRCGLVCSSGARRLRPWGIDPKLEFDVAKWFLADADDVRSSDYLELAATDTNPKNFSCALGACSVARWVEGWETDSFERSQPWTFHCTTPMTRPNWHD
jgi:hypothetical protein